MAQDLANPSAERMSFLDGSLDGTGDTPLFAIDVRSILAAVRRNILPFIAIVAGAIAIGVIATVLAVPQYVATSRVLVELTSEGIIEDEVISGAAYRDSDRFIQTQVDIINSESMAERVVESEGLADSEQFFAAMGADMPSEEDYADVELGPDGIAGQRRRLATRLLRGSVEAEAPIESGIVAISVQTGDKVVSADLANAVAANYIESNLARKFDSSAYARQFLAQQLAEARDKVEKSERDLNQYSREAGLIRVTGQTETGDRETTLSVTNDSLMQVNAAASAATAERIGAEDRWRNIANRPPMSVPQVLQNSAVQNLLVQRSRTEAELAEERSRHLDDHPNVIALNSQLERVNSQIDEIGSSIKRAVRLEYESAVDRENSLKNQVSSLRSDALNEQDRGVQFNLLRRVAETDRALYNTLLTRYNELNATAGAASNNVSLVDMASPPAAPSSPNLILNLLLATIAGLGLGAAFIFLRETMDDVMRTPDDVERKLGLPLLGLVPQVEQEDIQEELSDPKSSISEAYQSLVTNLRYASAEGLPRTLAVTSSQAGEGKTTTSQTLAREFAGLGRRVLLIDADLRRPTLHRIMADKTTEGLTALLAGEKTVDQVIVRSDYANLDYISALPIPPAPSALLATADFRGLIDQMLTRYDTIIFDAPPVLGLSDAPVVSTNVDAVLMVIDAAAGRRGAAKSALRRLEMVNAPVIGAILTKFDARAAGGEYSYYGADYYAYSASDSR